MPGGPRRVSKPRPVYTYTGELVALTVDEEQLMNEIRQQLSERWPTSNFVVQASQISTKDGIPVEPKPERRFGVGYTNGPKLADVVAMIQGRTKICICRTTPGAILWLYEDKGIKSHLGMRGVDVGRDIDLSEPQVVAQIAAIDAWAKKAGIPGGAVWDEGYEILFWAQRTERATGTPWPRGVEKG
jgi:hypothetical protein